APRSHTGRRDAAPAMRPSGARRRRLGGLDQLAERGGVARRDLGERLPVELDPGALQARHQLAVADLVGARRGVDAHDPQPAEAALLALAARVGEVARPVGRFLRELVELALPEEVALGPRQQLLALLAALGAPLDSRHGPARPSLLGVPEAAR